MKKQTVAVYLEVNNIVVYQTKLTDPYPLQICENVVCEVCLNLENLNVRNYLLDNMKDYK